MKHPGIVFAYELSERPSQDLFYAVSYPKDLSRHPSGDSSIPLDPFRESVVLPGEPLSILKEENSFVFVRAWWQPRWNLLCKRFEPYEGWISKDGLEILDQAADWRLVTSHQAATRSRPTFDLPIVRYLPMAALYKKNATQEEDPAWHCLEVEGEAFFVHDKDVSEWNWLDDCSADLIRWQWRQGAARMKGLSYVFGGLRTDAGGKSRSVVMQGIDCSGLLFLSARRMGSIIPRDAKDQYRYFTPIEASQICPGDLVFLGQESSEKIDHVIMQEEMGYWLESSRHYPAVVLHDSETRALKQGEKLWCASMNRLITSKDVGE